MHILMTIRSNFICFYVNEQMILFSVVYALNNLCGWFLLIGYVFYKLVRHMSDIMSYR